MSTNGDFIAFCLFISNVQPSRSQIPNTLTLKLKVFIIVTFYFTKHEI